MKLKIGIKQVSIKSERNIPSITKMTNDFLFVLEENINLYDRKYTILYKTIYGFYGGIRASLKNGILDFSFPLFRETIETEQIENVISIVKPNADVPNDVFKFIIEKFNKSVEIFEMIDTILLCDINISNDTIVFNPKKLFAINFPLNGYNFNILYEDRIPFYLEYFQTDSKTLCKDEVNNITHLSLNINIVRDGVLGHTLCGKNIDYMGGLVSPFVSKFKRSDVNCPNCISNYDYIIKLNKDSKLN